MKLKTLRTIVGVSSAISIVGMIVSAILNHIGSVIAFGLVGAIGILVMVTSTTVVNADVASSYSSNDAITGEALEKSVVELTSKYAVDKRLD